MPGRGVRRQEVDPCLREPGAALAQGGECRHGAGVPIEVIQAHPIEDEQHDRSRSRKTGPQDRQDTTGRARWQLHAKRGPERRRNVLLHGWHRDHPRIHGRAREQQRNRDVIRPWRTVHERRVRVEPREDVAFAGHDQELAAPPGEVGPRVHLQETLSRRNWGGIRSSLDLPARNRASHRAHDQDEQEGTASAKTRFTPRDFVCSRNRATIRESGDGEG